MSAPRTASEEPEKRSRTSADARAGGTGSRQDVPPAADGPSAVPPATATAPAGPPAHLEPGGALLLTGLRLAPVPDEVSPQGIMFRGAPRAHPGPGMPYTLSRRDLV